MDVTSPTSDACRPLTLSWWAAITNSVVRLCDGNFVLLLVLVLVNSIWLPYQGLTHDSQFYAFEVLHQTTEGQFLDDVSACYVRSGKFSVFGSLVVPIARLWGIPTTFFVYYLLAKTFLLYAVLRLVTRLVPDRRVAVLSLLVIALSPVAFGGLCVQHVNESFLTPRVPGIGLVVMGLSFVLQQRWVWASGFMLLAFALHPIMAVGGLLALGGCWLAARLRPGRLSVVLSVIAVLTTAILLTPSLSFRLFGELDAGWRDYIDDFSYYSMPQKWLIEDWLRAVIAVLLVGGASWIHPDLKRLRRPLLVIAVVSALGLVGGFLAARLPYARLFQSQPYRAPWIAQLIQIPIGCYVASRLWNMPGSALKCLGFAIASYFLCSHVTVYAHANLIFCGIALYRHLRGRESESRWQAIALMSLLVASLLYLVKIGSVLPGHVLNITTHTQLQFWSRLAALALGPFLMLLGSLVIVWAVAKATSPRRLPWFLAGVALFVQLSAHVLPNSNWAKRVGVGRAKTVALVRSYLNENEAADSCSIYWAGAKPGQVWFDIGAQSFFCVEQLSGTMFLRSSAVEGRRRAELVSPFGLAAFRREPIPRGGWQRQMISEVFQAPISAPNPTVADLARLINETNLDLVVTNERFSGLYQATNGDDFVYDLRVLRNRADQSSGRDETLSLVKTPDFATPVHRIKQRSRLRNGFHLN